MKKLPIVAITAAVLIALTGCGGGATTGDAPKAPATAQSAEAEAAVSVAVPNVVGVTVAEARAALEGIGLDFVTTSADTDIVNSQIPVAGEQSPEGTPVIVTAAPPAPTFTVAQENAIKSAKSYLAYSGFSRVSLIHQLEYEGFTTDEATFAADNQDGGVDWSAEAAESADSYMKYGSFSRDGLYAQLEYEGFTPDEINFGLAAVGY